MTPPVTFKYGVAPPTGRSAEEILRDMHPELELRTRVKLLEQKVAVLTEAVETLLKERKTRKDGGAP